jgi:hypothetical protein
MASAIRSRERVDKFLGRFMTSDGRVLSARLNPEIVSQFTGISKVEIAEQTKELETDPEIAATLLDVAATVSKEGGRRRKRGGEIKTVKAIGNLINNFIQLGPGSLELLDTAIASTINNIGTIAKVTGSVTGAVTLLNHPTVFGNLVEIGARITQMSVESAITTTWRDWWEAFKQTGDAAKILGETVMSQSIQGPVVPLAIATAIMSYRASETGRSVWQVIKDDTNTALSALAKGATNQIQEFQDAYQKEAQAATFRSLKEIASTLKKPVGKGAEELSMLVKQTGAPSAQSGISDEAIALVPSSKEAKEPKLALEPMTNIPAQSLPSEAEAAKALITLGKPGGRKKTRRAPKRRVTRRRRMLTFAY